MSRTKFIVAVSALAFAVAPMVAQAATPPAQGTVQPRHVTHPAPSHKMPKAAAVHPDMSADQLNAKELASIQHGPADAAPAMPAK